MKNYTDIDAASESQQNHPIDAIGNPIRPVEDATVPYWRTEAHPIDEHRSTPTLPIECDIAIIGAGLSGVATAYHLTDGVETPGQIVMLEARQVCSGATGRNGGHCKIKPSTVHSLIKRFGLESATEIYNFTKAQIYALKDVVKKERLECEFELRRSYDVYIDECEAGQAKEMYQASVNAGQQWTQQVDYVGPEFAEQVTSIKGAKAALSTPICSFWPYRFVSQLLARLIQREVVNLQTNTLVTKVSLDPKSGLTTLDTPRGSLKARKVVFATNAYTGGISSSYHNKIIPYRGTACHISPQKPISPHLSHTYNISYPPGFTRVDYLNPRPDGGIVVGGGQWTYKEDRKKWYNNVDDSSQLEEARPHFDGLMQRHFMGWGDSNAKIDHIWTGIQGLTADELCHVGEVPGKPQGSQYVIAGFNGGGNAFIFLAAKGLADMVRSGATFENSGLPSLFKTTKERLQETPAIV